MQKGLIVRKETIFFGPKSGKTQKYKEIAIEDACGMDSPYLFLYQNTYQNLHLPAFLIAGCFAFSAIVLSLLLTFQHLRSYTNPSEQKWIVAVLFMVPVYATESILSLWNAKFSLVCDILRNCYEAFALYAFGSYLIACLGGEREVVDLLEDEARRQISKPLLEEKEDPQSEQKTFRNFILRPCVLGEHLFTIIKFGLVQYMIMKTLCAFLAFILELFGAYGDGNFKWYYGCGYRFVVYFRSSAKGRKISNWTAGFPHLRRDGYRSSCSHFRLLGKTLSFHTSIPYGKITTQETKAMVKIEEGDKEKPALLEKRETVVQAPGTSVKESVQDIVVEGGQKVMEDVVLTINQAIEPVHEGMTKIQETFHHISVSSDSKDEPEVKVEEVEQNITIES
ncbi:UNVERIFIED_CONTAM: protein LAZ12 [Sesamum latifolium]|uniref:Protein LAZ12 n=1 Tax=Sesamum latifolium TaxID=2727402 RepID=A0AAW2VCF0_9LAMI